MTANRKSTDPIVDDDAPDMSTPYWQERLATAEIKRGRPKAALTEGPRLTEKARSKRSSKE